MKSEAPSKPKGLPGGQVAKTLEHANYQDGAVVSRKVVKKPTGSVTLFAFDEGQGLSEHAAPFDAQVQVLEGEAEISISGNPHRLHGGEMILIPARETHALNAIMPSPIRSTWVEPEKITQSSVIDEIVKGRVTPYWQIRI